MHIWIDNDACPKDVREVIFRASKRLSIPIKIVANSYAHAPKDVMIETVVVGSGFDAADDYIANAVTKGDLVVTADIPLAGRVVANGGVAVSPRGMVYTEQNIAEEVALRNLRQELRSAGEITGGPRPYSKEDLHKFAASLDKLLTKMR